MFEVEFQPRSLILLGLSGGWLLWVSGLVFGVPINVIVEASFGIYFELWWWSNECCLFLC